MTISEMIARLHQDKVLIKVSNGTWTPSSEFRCELQKIDDDVMLSSTGKSGATVDDAIRNAYNKFYGIVEKGLPEFSGALIEHQAPELPTTPAPGSPPLYETDDDIPF